MGSSPTGGINQSIIMHRERYHQFSAARSAPVGCSLRIPASYPAWPGSTAGPGAEAFRHLSHVRCRALFVVPELESAVPCRYPQPRRLTMGNEPRIALILTAAASLLAVMVDWVVEELS